MGYQFIFSILLSMTLPAVSPGNHKQSHPLRTHNLEQIFVRCRTVIISGLVSDEIEKKEVKISKKKVGPWKMAQSVPQA